jgi:hypothetical protein
MRRTSNDAAAFKRIIMRILGAQNRSEKQEAATESRLAKTLRAGFEPWAFVANSCS